MEPFDAYFNLKLSFLVFFPAAEQLSTNLQAKDVTVAKGSRGAFLLIVHYTSLWTEAVFSTFYKSVLKSASGLTDEPTRP